MTTYSHPVEEHEDVWYPYARFHGFYDPVMVGSIDGTDTVPHDRAVMRCLSATYKPKFSECLGLDPKATLFVGRLSPQTTSSVLIEALHSLLRRPAEQQQSKRSPESRHERRSRLRHRSRSPFESSVPENRTIWPKVRLVRDIATGYPCGYAFAYFENPRDAESVLRNWTQRARSMAGSQYGAKPEGLDIPGGEKVILEPAFAESLPGWRPRRLGGGLGGRKEAGQLRFGGIARPFRRPFNFHTS